MAKQIHKMLIDLHKVCKVNAKFHNYMIPKINVNFQEKRKMIDEFNNGVHVKPGRKFDKVVTGTSVWGFIAKTNGVLKGIPYFVGDVFKAAGWRAPAKHVRGTIFSSETKWFSWTGPRYL